MPGQVTATTLDIPESAIADLRERLTRTRFPDQAPGPAWAYGTDVEYLRQLVEPALTGGPKRRGSTASRSIERGCAISTCISYMCPAEVRHPARCCYRTVGRDRFSSSWRSSRD
jgi:hypothetical protein